MGQADTNGVAIPTVALSDLQVRTAKPAEKLRKLSEGRGCNSGSRQPDGVKRWRLAYRFAGRQKALALGVYLFAVRADCSH